MTTTPTPGDLSARLRIIACDYPLGSIIRNTLDQTIAALSALPAAGEPVAKVYAGAFGIHYIACADPNKLPVGTKLYTTPPADADVVEWDGATRTMREHLYLMTGERDRYKALHEQAAPTIARMGRRISELDADVGAQGDDPGEFGVGIMPNQKARYWQGRADFWRGQAIALGYNPESAAPAAGRCQECCGSPCECPSGMKGTAPAAGKGVDGLPISERTIRALHLAVGMDPDKPNGDALLAKVVALTRQPAEVEHEGDTCRSNDLYAGNSVGWWKSKADNYKAGLSNVCDALGSIGVKMDGRTPCWKYVAQLSPRQPVAGDGVNGRAWKVGDRVIWTSRFGKPFAGTVTCVRDPIPVRYEVELDDGALCDPFGHELTAAPAATPTDGGEG